MFLSQGSPKQQKKQILGNYALDVTCVLLVCRPHRSFRICFACFFCRFHNVKNMFFQPRLDYLVFFDFPSHCLRDVWPAVTRFTWLAVTKFTVLEGTCREQSEQGGSVSEGKNNITTASYYDRMCRAEKRSMIRRLSPPVQVSFCGSMAC